MRMPPSSRFLVLAALLASGAAQAHPGHGGGLAAGLVHPLTGVDHLLAMVAVGIWAAQLGGRAKWLVPASFVSVMAVAGSVAMAGLQVPMIEGGIAASLLVMGLLVAFAVAMPVTLAAPLVAIFAFFHGLAHGSELPAMVSPWSYACGFIVATISLHGIGLWLGHMAAARALMRRVAGFGVATAGVCLMVM